MMGCVSLLEKVANSMNEGLIYINIDSLLKKSRFDSRIRMKTKKNESIGFSEKVQFDRSSKINKFFLSSCQLPEAYIMLEDVFFVESHRLFRENECLETEVSLMKKNYMAGSSFFRKDLGKKRFLRKGMNIYSFFSYRKVFLVV